VLRAETKQRARVLQLLYAWELRDKPPIQHVVEEIVASGSSANRSFVAAESTAIAVSLVVPHLDDEISKAADNWRLDRIGAIERNILRLALHELEAAEVPARVTISEAVKLAHWFAGSKAPSFVNGVLDGLARDSGRL